MSRSIRYWQSLTTVDFAALDLGKTVAILPVAAIEQHGPHLPLEVDATINKAVLEMALSIAPEDMSVLVLPSQVIGYSEEHQSFPGTLTFSAETVLRTWRELGECVARAGIRKLLIFNSHGGQNELMAVAARQLRAANGLFVVTSSWSHLVRLDDLFDVDELKFGIHGGAVETSIMLHVALDQVRTEKIDNFRSQGQTIAEQSTHLAATGRVAYGWMTEDLNPSGAVGDATKANAALGAEILSRAAKGLVQLLEDVERVDVDAG